MDGEKKHFRIKITIKATILKDHHMVMVFIFGLKDKFMKVNLNKVFGKDWEYLKLQMVFIIKDHLCDR
jgi:hypothetical protein